MRCVLRCGSHFFHQAVGRYLFLEEPDDLGFPFFLSDHLRLLYSATIWNIDWLSVGGVNLVPVAARIELDVDAVEAKSIASAQTRHGLLIGTRGVRFQLGSGGHRNCSNNKANP